MKERGEEEERERRRERGGEREEGRERRGEGGRKGWEGGRVPVSKTTLNVCGGVPIETGPKYVHEVKSKQRRR